MSHFTELLPQALPAEPLPQIAGDFGASIGAAAVVVTSYALAHGSSSSSRTGRSEVA